MFGKDAFSQKKFQNILDMLSKNRFTNSITNSFYQLVLILFYQHAQHTRRTAGPLRNRDGGGLRNRGYPGRANDFGGERTGVYAQEGTGSAGTSTRRKAPSGRSGTAGSGRREARTEEADRGAESLRTDSEDGEGGYAEEGQGGRRCVQDSFSLQDEVRKI